MVGLSVATFAKVQKEGRPGQDERVSVMVVSGIVLYDFCVRSSEEICTRFGE